MNVNDAILWERYRQGDKDSLATLFKQHYTTLYRYGTKIAIDTHLVDDHIQELFIEIWQQKSPVPIISVSAYLLKALRYKIIKINRAGQKFITLSADNYFVISHEAFIIESEEDRIKVDMVLKTFSKLPARQREIIYLRFYLNMSYDDICKIMNIGYQVARNQVSNAIQNMKKAMLILLIYYFNNLK